MFKLFYYDKDKIVPVCKQFYTVPRPLPDPLAFIGLFPFISPEAVRMDPGGPRPS